MKLTEKSNYPKSNALDNENKLVKQENEDDSSYPFLAIQGQDDLKLGLILNVIEPEIRGILIIGDRGTGKSTTIRACKNVLPDIFVIKKDAYNRDPLSVRRCSNLSLLDSKSPVVVTNVQDCFLDTSPRNVELKPMPIINLPLGATEDRVCGSINLERAVTEGKKAFEPGLLAQANRGLLYVDEVNLLEDFLVDVLLDAAASGYTVVEREGLSVYHPSKFILIGSGNPEEGEIRPQLLDRFGLYTEIKTVEEPIRRLKIIRSREHYDKNKNFWKNLYSLPEEYMKQKIEQAQYLYKTVQLSSELRQAASYVCKVLKVDGLRADLVLCRAAKALAAFNEDEIVTAKHFRRVSQLCLRHRLRKDPLDTVDSGAKVQDAIDLTFV